MNAFLLLAVALKVLAIGNSFSICMPRDMAPVVESMGLELDIAATFSSGCPLVDQVKNANNPDDLTYSLEWSRNGKFRADWPELSACLMDKTEINRKTKEPKQVKRCNLAKVLAAEKWDVVTVQQASHYSWQPATYNPWGDNLIEIVKKLAPTAKIVVHETWSYTPWDRRLKTWNIDQDMMYSALHGAYRDFANKRKLDIIPTGTAVQLVRKELPVRYTENSFGGDVVGSAKFEQDKNGKWTPVGDVFHMNPDGNYLQSLVWTAKLLNVDVTKCKYARKGMKPERAEFLKRIAMKAVKGE